MELLLTWPPLKSNHLLWNGQELSSGLKLQCTLRTATSLLRTTSSFLVPKFGNQLNSHTLNLQRYVILRNRENLTVACPYKGPYNLSKLVCARQAVCKTSRFICNRNGLIEHTYHLLMAIETSQLRPPISFIITAKRTNYFWWICSKLILVKLLVKD